MHNDNEDEQQGSQTPFDINLDELPLLTFFYQRFKPAYNFREATLYMTTESIYRMLLEHHTGIPFEPHLLTAWLVKNGYRFDNIDLKIVWLLREDLYD